MAESGQFELRLGGPLDFTQALAGFRRSGDDLLDRWDGEWLLRTLRLDRESVAYAARATGTIAAPALEVTAETAAQAKNIREAIKRSFPEIPLEFQKLCADDPIIGRLARIHRGFRPVLHPDLLVALIRCISAQQVNLRWAATTRRRLAEKYGRRHEVRGMAVRSLDPQTLASADVAEIRALQFTTRKAEYIVNVARAISESELDLSQLSRLPDDEIVERITAVRGLGRWTAEWILARTLGRPCVSASDLGVRKAVGKAYLGGRIASPDEVRQATAHWGLAAAFAQELILYAQHEKTLEHRANESPMIESSVR
ncbi:MAG: DNA-3-methyladenine glycosylase family protein [Candidatus Binataceae bacterium]